MTDNRNPIPARLGPLGSDGAEAPWVEVRGKRVLVAEDQEPVRACLRMLLEMEGHQVTEASNGAEALKAFASGHFDLVITDFEMPVLNGNELAVRIKQLAPSLPILMISASTWARRDAKNPVDALLEKPFTVAGLHTVLEKLLSARTGSLGLSQVSTQESPCVTLDAEGTGCCRSPGVTLSAGF